MKRSPSVQPSHAVSGSQEPEGSAAQQEYILRLPLLVHREVELLAVDRRPALRGAVRNLVPFLSGWFIARELSDPRGGVASRSPGHGDLPRGVRRSAETALGGTALGGTALGGTIKRSLSTLKRSVSTLLSLGARRPFTALKAASSEPGPLSRDVLLCVSLQPNSTRAFLPVARELGPQLVCFLLDPTDLDSQQQVTEAGAQFRCLPQVGGAHELLELAENAAGIANLGGTTRLRSLVERCAGPHSPALGRAELRRLQRSVSWQLVRGVSFAARLEQALDRLLPRQVLFITHRALIDEVLRHRPEVERRIFYLQGIVPPLPPVFTPLDVHLAIAGSTLDVGYLRRCGVSEQHTVLAGYPDYDVLDYDGLGDLRREECTHELGLKYSVARGRPLVVFTSQYKTSAFPDWARKWQLATVVETARLRPDLFFILKPHPRLETLDETWLTQLPENVAVERMVPTLRLLLGAAVTVTYWSTTALESVLLGTPLVQLNATGLPDYFPLVTDFGQRPARDAYSLSAGISAALSEQGRESFVSAREQWLVTRQIVLDQGAAVRVAVRLRDFLFPVA